MDILSRSGASAALEWGAANPLLYGTLFSLAAGATLILQTLRTWMRLRHIGGPSLAGFTNFWLVRVVMGGNTHWELGRVNEKHGKLRACHASGVVTPA